MCFRILLFTLLFTTHSLAHCGERSSSCSVDALFTQAHSISEKTFQDAEEFQKEISEKSSVLLNNSHFQEILEEIQRPFPHALKQQSKQLQGQLYVFVSFSMGEKALLNLAAEARSYGATLILRGFKYGSYKKTAKALQHIIQKTVQGFVIDPELFTLFNVTTAPTMILSKSIPLLSSDRIQTPLHDRLQGHVSMRYPLERFAQEGDLREEAKALLRQGERL